MRFVLRFLFLTTMQWNAFSQKENKLFSNVNINWMQIGVDKVLNFNVEFIFNLHFLSLRTQKNSTLRISNDVLVRLNITYPILSSSTWRILSARSKTFLMIFCSLSVISDFVPVFLAGPLEWKDHPEFNLKWGEKTLSNDVLQATALIYQSLLLISTTSQRKLIKSCKVKEDKGSSQI